MKKTFNKILILISIITGIVFLISLRNKGDEKPQETMVLISTNLGDIGLKLYNETPKHRDNFIKLVNEHFYDSLLFHRVIQNFMIQGGDPESRKAKPGVMLGNGETGYTIPAEFNPKLFHKKGALAAARQGDEVNPEKASSGCQFYIVQGKPLNNADLESYEARINMGAKQKLFSAFINRPENQRIKDRFMAYQKENKSDSLQNLSAQIEPMLDKELTTKFKFSEEQRKVYTTIGGTPHLDGGYTVFGEVLQGVDILDKIAATPVDQASRPLNDVRILKAVIVKK